MNQKVDDFLQKTPAWEKELSALRSLLLDCGLTEEIKWGTPCYMYQSKNIIMLGSFKEYCALSFIKGVLLLDEESLLIKPGANSQSVKYFKFTSLQEITKLQSIIKAYIYEAIEVEKAGLTIDKSKSTEFELPEELLQIFKSNAKIKNAFEALTTGRQRAYAMYFSDAKQPKTREARIEKYIPRILKGKGMADCVCGLTKHKPNCDGSHKQIKDFNPFKV
jgi:uncharacterized protein YdeI (YjbR/CyaY-like superfamily)